jgi:hypothetical protein
MGNHRPLSVENEWAKTSQIGRSELSGLPELYTRKLLYFIYIYS